MPSCVWCSAGLYLSHKTVFSFHHSHPPPPPPLCLLLHSAPPLQPILPPVAVSSVDLERLERVERQLALLWSQVQQGDQKQEERHGDALGLYSTLREHIHTQTNRESLGLWVSSLLEQRLGILRGELEQENIHRVQVKGETLFYLKHLCSKTKHLLKNIHASHFFSSVSLFHAEWRAAETTTRESGSAAGWFRIAAQSSGCKDWGKNSRFRKQL